MKKSFGNWTILDLFLILIRTVVGELFAERVGNTNRENKKETILPYKERKRKKKKALYIPNGRDELPIRTSGLRSKFKN